MSNDFFHVFFQKVLGDNRSKLMTERLRWDYSMLDSKSDHEQYINGTLGTRRSKVNQTFILLGDVGTSRQPVVISTTTRKIQKTLTIVQYSV
jgi:hypothetical protein